LQLFGFPEAIFADIRIVRPVSKVDDYFEVLLYYPSLRVRLHSSYLVKEALPGYILHGSKGSFIKAKTDVQETDLQAGKIPCGPDWGKEPDSERGLLHIDRKGEDVKEYLVSLQGNYGDYFEGVYEAIRMGKPAPVSAEDGLDVIRVITAAFKSSEEQKVIRLS
jgi:predicted dehydrogenase